MKRRESIKSLLVGSLAGGAMINGCTPDATTDPIKDTITDSYGRTETEKKRDRQLTGESYFTEKELETISTLCDLILPEEGDLKSASQVGVPGFVEFIVKDIPRHQLPIRGGLSWLDLFCKERYNLRFTELQLPQQTDILDQIAYPEEAKPEVSQGVAFFSLIRGLTMTGYYTTREGIEELGYKGNTPNVWDGVPEEILEEHSLSYEREWLAKCVDQDKRMDTAQWDEHGNLTT